MDQRLIEQVMHELGASPQHLHRCIQTQPTFERACKALEELKVEVRKKYKQLAFRWHPDRNPDDSEAEQKFKILGRVIEDLGKLKLRPPRPRPVMRVVQFYPQTSPFGGATTVTTGMPFTGVHPMDSPTGTATTTGTYNARRAVFIRYG